MPLISKPLANFGSPPVGVGVNMHQTQIPSPGTVLGKFSAMRNDDIPSGGLLAALTNFWDYAKAAQFNIWQLIDQGSWAGNTVGHVRDVALLGGADVIECDNEPDQRAGFDPVVFTTTQKQIWAMTRFGCNARLAGPCFSMWSPANRAKFATLIANGYCDYVDIVSLHTYPLVNTDPPELAATQIADMRSMLDAAGYQRLPIVISEIGAPTAYVETFLGLGAGGWTAAAAAGLINRFVAACLGAGAKSVFVYDGPLSTNLDGYVNRTMVTTPSTGNTVAVADTTGFVDGKVIYFSNVAAFRTIDVGGVIDSKHVRLTSNVSVTTLDGVYFTDTHEAITDNTNLTAMGTALTGLLPVGGVANA